MINLLASNATTTVLEALAREYEKAHGERVSVRADSAKVMLGRIRDGETADVAILNAPHLDELVDAGVIEARSRRPFARSHIGVAVRKGIPHPDISTVDALRRALVRAHRVAHTVHGASGMYVPTLLQRLGIAGEVQTVTRPGGLIAKVVAAGEADIAVQQLSELLAVPEVEVVGLLPDDVQQVLESSAGVFAASAQREAGAALLRFFAQPSSAPVFRAHGLEQMR